MQPAFSPARYSPRVALLGLVVTAALLAPVASTPVSAASAAHQLASVRAQVDQLGNQYFAARRQLQTLDKQVAQLRTARARIERRYAQEHRLAVRRAVARYTEATTFQDDAANVM